MFVNKHPLPDEGLSINGNVENLTTQFSAFIHLSSLLKTSFYWMIIRNLFFIFRNEYFVFIFNCNITKSINNSVENKVKC